MNSKSAYREQKRLSLIQLFTELPDFILLSISAVLSGSLIVWMDLLDSFGYILRHFTVVLISKKLSRNLKYEYNYGCGKVEAIAALLCEGVLLLGLVLISGLSVYELVNVSQPSGLLLGVVGFKLYNVICDVVFFRKQCRLNRKQNGAIAQNGYAAAFGALLFDGVTLAALLIIWLLRSSPVSGYISPVISMLIAIYLMIGCFRRIASALTVLTDKTLPEKMQMQILQAVVSLYDQYSLFHRVDSHNVGDHLHIDVVVSFEDGTTAREIMAFKENVQSRIEDLPDDAVVNIIIQ